jgi:hypothetical protein
LVQQTHAAFAQSVASAELSRKYLFALYAFAHNNNHISSPEGNSSGAGSVELEEVPGKEHWWWDTHYANDGGALNDKTVVLLC